MSEKFNYIENTLNNNNRSFEHIAFDSIENFKPKQQISSLLGIHIIIDGLGSFKSDDNMLKIKKGQIIISNPYSGNIFYTENNEKLSMYSFGILSKGFDFGKDSYKILELENFKFFSEVANHIFELMGYHEIETITEANNYFLLMFQDLKSKAKLVATEIADDNKKMTSLPYQVLEYIDNNALKKISLAKLTERFYVSTSLLLHSFKKEFNETIMEHVFKKKLEVAKYLLRESYFSVSYIVRDVGFSSEQFFYKYFLKNTGLTPIQYRNKYRS